MTNFAKGALASSSFALKQAGKRGRSESPDRTSSSSSVPQQARKRGRLESPDHTSSSSSVAQQAGKRGRLESPDHTSSSSSVSQQAGKRGQFESILEYTDFTSLEDSEFLTDMYFNLHICKPKLTVISTKYWRNAVKELEKTYSTLPPIYFSYPQDLEDKERIVLIYSEMNNDMRSSLNSLFDKEPSFNGEKLLLLNEIIIIADFETLSPDTFNRLAVDIPKKLECTKDDSLITLNKRVHKNNKKDLLQPHISLDNRTVLYLNSNGSDLRSIQDKIQSLILLESPSPEFEYQLYLIQSKREQDGLPPLQLFQLNPNDVRFLFKRKIDDIEIKIVAEDIHKYILGQREVDERESYIFILDRKKVQEEDIASILVFCFNKGISVFEDSSIDNIEKSPLSVEPVVDKDLFQQLKLLEQYPPEEKVWYAERLLHYHLQILKTFTTRSPFSQMSVQANIFKYLPVKVKDTSHLRSKIPVYKGENPSDDLLLEGVPIESHAEIIQASIALLQKQYFAEPWPSKGLPHGNLEGDIFPEELNSISGGTFPYAPPVYFTYNLKAYQNNHHFLKDNITPPNQDTHIDAYACLSILYPEVNKSPLKLSWPDRVKQMHTLDILFKYAKLKIPKDLVLTTPTVDILKQLAAHYKTASPKILCIESKSGLGKDKACMHFFNENNILYDHYNASVSKQLETLITSVNESLNENRYVCISEVNLMNAEYFIKLLRVITPHRYHRVIVTINPGNYPGRSSIELKSIFGKVCIQNKIQPLMAKDYLELLDYIIENNRSKTLELNKADRKKIVLFHLKTIECLEAQGSQFLPSTRQIEALINLLSDLSVSVLDALRRVYSCYLDLIPLTNPNKDNLINLDFDEDEINTYLDSSQDQKEYINYIEAKLKEANTPIPQIQFTDKQCVFFNKTDDLLYIPRDSDLDTIQSLISEVIANHAYDNLNFKEEELKNHLLVKEEYDVPQMFGFFNRFFSFRASTTFHLWVISQYIYFEKEAHLPKSQYEQQCFSMHFDGLEITLNYLSTFKKIKTLKFKPIQEIFKELFIGSIMRFATRNNDTKLNYLDLIEKMTSEKYYVRYSKHSEGFDDIHPSNIEALKIIKANPLEYENQGILMDLRPGKYSVIGLWAGKDFKDSPKEDLIKLFGTISYDPKVIDLFWHESESKVALVVKPKPGINGGIHWVPLNGEDYLSDDRDLSIYSLESCMGIIYSENSKNNNLLSLDTNTHLAESSEKHRSCYIEINDSKLRLYFPNYPFDPSKLEPLELQSKLERKTYKGHLNESSIKLLEENIVQIPSPFISTGFISILVNQQQFSGNLYKDPVGRIFIKLANSDKPIKSISWECFKDDLSTDSLKFQVKLLDDNRLKIIKSIPEKCGKQEHVSSTLMELSKLIEEKEKNKELFKQNFSNIYRIITNFANGFKSESLTISEKIVYDESNLLALILSQKGVCRHISIITHLLFTYFDVKSLIVSNESHQFIELQETESKLWQKFEANYSLAQTNFNDIFHHIKYQKTWGLAELMKRIKACDPANQSESEKNTKQNILYILNHDFTFDSVGKDRWMPVLKKYSGLIFYKLQDLINKQPDTYLEILSEISPEPSDIDPHVNVKLEIICKDPKFLNNDMKIPPWQSMLYSKCYLPLALTKIKTLTSDSSVVDDTLITLTKAVFIHYRQCLGNSDLVPNWLKTQLGFFKDFTTPETKPTTQTLTDMPIKQIDFSDCLKTVLSTGIYNYQLNVVDDHYKVTVIFDRPIHTNILRKLLNQLQQAYSKSTHSKKAQIELFTPYGKLIIDDVNFIKRSKQINTLSYGNYVVSKLDTQLLKILLQEQKGKCFSASELVDQLDKQEDAKTHSEGLPELSKGLTEDESSINKASSSNAHITNNSIMTPTKITELPIHSSIETDMKSNEKAEASKKIQSLWRGYSLRSETSFRLPYQLKKIKEYLNDWFGQDLLFKFKDPKAVSEKLIDGLYDTLLNNIKSREKMSQKEDSHLNLDHKDLREEQGRVNRLKDDYSHLIFLENIQVFIGFEKDPDNVKLQWISIVQVSL